MKAKINALHVIKVFTLMMNHLCAKNVHQIVKFASQQQVVQNAPIVTLYQTGFVPSVTKAALLAKITQMLV